MSEPPGDYDSPWKEALERYFEPFLALCFPEVHQGIEWSRGVEFLDKELQQIVRDAESGRRYADKLVKVWRPHGEETWVLVHVELQADVDPDFAARMYRYHRRIFDRYERHVVSLGVLGDRSAGWRPSEFTSGLWGCELTLRYPVRKLLDFEADWEGLEASANPFVPVVMTHLKAQATRQDPESRLRWKVRLVKGLYERGLGRQDVLELFRFIDWMMSLPVELEQGFQRELAEYEQERQMAYITSIERAGIERGIEQGIEQGMIRMGREAVLAILRVRFPELPGEVATRVEGVSDADALRGLVDAAAGANSLAEFLRTLEASPPGE